MQFCLSAFGFFRPGRAGVSSLSSRTMLWEDGSPVLWEDGSHVSWERSVTSFHADTTGLTSDTVLITADLS